MKLKQFEIWMTDLEPHTGSEQGGNRPVVIVETNAASPHAATTVVIPLSSQIIKTYSFDVIVEPSSENGLTLRSKMMFRQIRVIDKIRLKKKRGVLERKYRPFFQERIGLLFDLEESYKD